MARAPRVLTQWPKESRTGRWGLVDERQVCEGVLFVMGRKRWFWTVIGFIGRRLPISWIQRAMWWTQAKFVVSVVAVVFQGDHTLLLRHSYRPRYAWGLPTGWVHAGETPQEAAKRELHEETGLGGSSLNALNVFRTTCLSRHHLELAFWTTIDQPVEVSASPDGEILEGQWVKLEEWPSALFPPQMELIRAAYRARQVAEGSLSQATQLVTTRDEEAYMGCGQHDTYLGSGPQSSLRP